jgi:hypothetical protein
MEGEKSIDATDVATIRELLDECNSLALSIRLKAWKLHCLEQTAKDPHGRPEPATDTVAEEFKSVAVAIRGVLNEALDALNRFV